MKNVTLAILIMTALACKRESCKVDGGFEKLYSQEVDKIKKVVKSYDGVLSYEGLRSIFFLNDLTNYESKVVIGDITYYESKSDYRRDIAQWSKWYTENKCFVTEEAAVAVMDSVIKSTYWMGE